MKRSAARRAWLRRTARASLASGILLFGLIGVQSVLANPGDTTTTLLETSGSPADYGTSVTFTATVVDTINGLYVPTGSVEFLDNGTVVDTELLDGAGMASYTTLALAPGSHPISASYLGDATADASGDGPITQVIDNAPTTTSLISDINPSVFGQSVSLTATVTGDDGVVPTGSVDFYDSTTSTDLGSRPLDGAGQAVLTTSGLSVGTHDVTATYGGDTYFSSGSTDDVSQVVHKADSTTVISSSLVTPTVVGQTYGVMVGVSAALPGMGTPTGSVLVSDGTDSCTVTLPSTSCNLQSTTAGAKTITATYSGDSDFNGGAGSKSHTVNQAATTTTLGTAPNPSVHGQQVTLTAAVTVVSPGAGTPTGTVTFKDGAVTLGSPMPLASGTASMGISSLSTGVHSSITAVYEGDTDFSGSSDVEPQTVDQAPTTTTVSSSVPTPPDPDPYGTSVTFTALVVVNSPGVGTPTGNVDFKSGASVIGSGSLDGTGHATYTTSALVVGGHAITAVYGGDTDFASSTTSPGITQTVTKAVPDVTVMSDTAPSVYGASVTFSASVAGTAGTPTGSVTFKDGATTIGSDPLDGSGDASVATALLGAGTHVITAVYGGDTNYSGATGTLSGGQEVDPATLTVTAADRSRAYGATNPALTVSYSGFQNGQNLATSDVTGSPSCSTTATPTSSVAGSPYTISCSTGTLASTNYTFTFVNGQLTITATPSSTAVGSDHQPSVFGQAVTFTATISGFGAGSATGSVDFIVDGGTAQNRPVSGNQATLSTSSLGVGTHTVTADYLGDGNVNASSGSLAGGQVVNKSTSATTITTDLSPVTFVGDAYAVAVTVAAAGNGAGTPTGSVTISDGTNNCVVTLSGGAGSCLLTSSTAGRPKTITATYGGDADFTGSSDSAPHTVDTPPVAAADSYTTNENGFVASHLTTTAGTGVLSNDHDADSDPLTAVKLSDPSHGTLTLNANGSFTYTPDALYIGGDSFTYADDDGYTDSPAATVTITVTAVNQPPSFTLVGSPDVTVAEDSHDSTAFSQAEVTAFTPGPPAESGQTLLGYVVTNDNHNMFAAGSGQPAIDASGTLTFKTFSNGNGVATVTVQARDSGGTANGGVDLSAAQTFTITVTPVNDNPTANGDLKSVGQNSLSNTIDVLANDRAGPPDEQPGGANAQTIQIASVTQPAHGHVTIINGNSQIDYVPSPDFVCPASTPQNCDTFTYTIIDNGTPPLSSSPGTVFLTVTPSVIRYAGADRYATGVAIVSPNYGADQPVIYVATGTNFPDGLAGAAAAGFRHAPLVLLNGQGSSIPSNVNNELNALIGPDTEILVLGGPVSVSAKIYNLLAAKAPLLGDGVTHDIARLADDNRYDTAVKVSRDTYPAPPASGAVFIASGLAYPDALSASSVAGHMGAPLILVPGNQASLASVPKVTAELTRLAPTTIYIAGGTVAVSTGIQSEIAGMFPTAQIVRFAGANRYETATKIADHFFQSPAVPPFDATPVHTVYVASGQNFPDALAGGALAASEGAPLLLVPGTARNIDGVVVNGHEVITEEFGSTRLFPNRIIIFGGSGAISTGIFNELVGFPKSS